MLFHVNRQWSCVVSRKQAVVLCCFIIGLNASSPPCGSVNVSLYCCRPLIQQKLNVLGKAGLSKDDFCDTDMHVLKVCVYTVV